MPPDDDHYYFGELGSLPGEPAEAAESWLCSNSLTRLLRRRCRSQKRVSTQSGISHHRHHSTYEGDDESR